MSHVFTLSEKIVLFVVKQFNVPDYQLKIYRLAHTFLLFFGLSGLSHAQQSVLFQQIDYLKDNSYTTELKADFNSKVGLHIININRRLVDIDQR